MTDTQTDQEQFRVTISTVPDNINELTFRGWLRKEIIEAEGSAEPDDILIVKIFIPLKLSYRLSKKKLDRIMQDMADKHDRVDLIESDITDKTLGIDELQKETERLAAAYQRMRAAGAFDEPEFFTSEDEIDEDDGEPDDRPASR